MTAISLRRLYADKLTQKGFKLRHACACGGGISSFTCNGNPNWIRIYENGKLTINKDKKEGQVLFNTKMDINVESTLEQIKPYFPSI